jgi:hypothetical protein
MVERDHHYDCHRRTRKKPWVVVVVVDAAVF